MELVEEQREAQQQAGGALDVGRCMGPPALIDDLAEGLSLGEVDDEVRDLLEAGGVVEAGGAQGGEGGAGDLAEQSDLLLETQEVGLVLGARAAGDLHGEGAPLVVDDPEVDGLASGTQHRDHSEAADLAGLREKPGTLARLLAHEWRQRTTGRGRSVQGAASNQTGVRSWGDPL